MQRYAGASTLFGPHTLEAYQQEFYKLAFAMAQGKSVDPGQPPAPCNNTFSLLPPVVVDDAPSSGFGSVEQDCNSKYTLGSVANVTFWGSDLRTNLMQNSSYLTVEMQQGDGSWKVVLDDADFETRLYWKRVGVARSHVTCSWLIPNAYGPVAVQGATYRISLSAFRKPLIGSIKPYTGHSSPFTLV